MRNLSIFENGFSLVNVDVDVAIVVVERLQIFVTIGGRTSRSVETILNDEDDDDNDDDDNDDDGERNNDDDGDDDMSVCFQIQAVAAEITHSLKVDCWYGSEAWILDEVTALWAS